MNKKKYDANVVATPAADFQGAAFLFEEFPDLSLDASAPTDEPMPKVSPGFSICIFIFCFSVC